jgi:hypothetical protein
MNAVLAIIVNGGQGIVDIDRELGRNKFITPLIHDIIKPFDGGLGQPLLQRLPRVGYARPTKTMLLEGQTAPSWWGCIRLCVLLGKSLLSKSILFLPERT